MTNTSREYLSRLLTGVEPITIWRYMSFTKFVSMLHTQSLFFTRADKFEDKFEGTLTLASFQKRLQKYQQIPGLTDEERTFALANRGSVDRLIRQNTFISCWHENEKESHAMWKVFLTDNEGVAIKTRVDLLTQSLGELPQHRRLYVARVKYGDFITEEIDESMVLLPFIFKRDFFEYERELRFIIWDNEIGEKMKRINEPPELESMSIPIDLEKMIQAVHLSPTSPQWFAEVVASVMDKYGLPAKGKIISSAISHLQPFV